MCLMLYAGRLYEFVVCHGATSWVIVLSPVRLFAWTVARQALLSMEFSRQEYWRGLPCPPPGAALAGRFFTTVPPGKP